MRIGIDYAAAVNQVAGIGRYTRCLVSALAEVDRDNEYVLFYGRRREQPKLPLAETPNFRGKMLPLSDWALTVLWHRLGVPVPLDVLTGRLHLLHSPDFVLPPLWRGAAVLTVHDLSFILFPECADSRLRAYLTKAVPLSVARADLVLVDSENTKNDVICLLDAAPERVEVLYLGVEDHFRPVADEARRAAVRAKYGLEGPFLLTVGLIEPRKNLTRLLEAYRDLRMRRRGWECRLVIAGPKGWLYEEVFRKVGELKLQDSITFLGFVAEEDLPVLYSLADLFVYPSLYEGFGLPPLEAMACGVPVVCSNAAALPEVVGDAAVTFPPTDTQALSAAVEEVLDREALRRTLVERGLKRAGQFSWRAAAQRLVELYRSLGA